MISQKESSLGNALHEVHAVALRPVLSLAEGLTKGDGFSLQLLHHCRASRASARQGLLILSLVLSYRLTLPGRKTTGRVRPGNDYQPRLQGRRYS